MVKFNHEDSSSFQSNFIVFHDCLLETYTLGPVVPDIAESGGANCR